jgi:(1->4)-alpha-D-glucan 1-alpha-D-glucosylmutase
LLAAQHYRPVCWKEKGQRINYRRFFDINDLVTLRIEDEQVFRAVHGRVLEMVRDGAVTGLRIDHVDGLHDPEGYLLRLQEYLAAAPAIDGYADAGFYVLVEKILGRDETLPSGWPVAGTTGYDFLNMLNGLFVDAQGLEELSGFYKKFTGSETELAALVYKQKKLVMRELFAGDMADLTERLLLLAGKDPGSKGGDRGVDGGVDRGVDADDLKAALAGVTAALPVYRTYIRGFSVTLRDRHYIDEALGLAAEYGDGSELARAFLRRVLLLQVTGDMPQETRLDWLAFVMRWQQFSGPIMAKGFEDTALYLDNRLISLNEVGSGAVAGSGTAAGSVAVAEFHRHMLAHQAESPHTMNTTSTHDTKRSEDVRARLNLLSEIPPIWAERVCRWQEWNAPKKPRPAGTPVPHGNEELLLYQTLIGAWPLHRADEAEFMERLAAYLVKASREAKVYTSWLDPNKAYEDAFCAFARLILEESADNRFKEDLLRLVKPLAYYGTFNSLSQLVLKAVSPGVPDFYMGSELWHYSLVDPDNRRPVDFPRRMALLAELRQKEPGAALTLVRDLLQNWDDGRLKLYVTWKALNLRREKAGLFSCGGYLPLEATGAAREHLCALARHAEGDWVVAAVPRLPLRLVSRVSPTAGAAEQTVALTAALTKVKSPTGRECWAETVLHLPRNAPDRWQNIFSGEIYRADRQILPLENVFGIFPVALLTPVSRFL